MKRAYLCFGFCLAVLSISVLGQPNPNQEMRTFSPYTPEQLKSFNAQKISPAEGPFGPVDMTQKQLNLQKKPGINSKFFNVPEGEQEAEALETESANPYQPMSPAISF